MITFEKLKKIHSQVIPMLMHLQESLVRILRTSSRSALCSRGRKVSVPSALDDTSVLVTGGLEIIYHQEGCFYEK